MTSLESTIQEIDQEVIALKDTIASSNSYLASLQNDVATLTTKRDELAATLSEKEERIQKLEKAKITQGMIARIERLKEEHSQFKAEAQARRCI